MKKTLNINIGSRVFNIDEDAYDLLSKYLESIKTYFEKIDTPEKSPPKEFQLPASMLERKVEF